MEVARVVKARTEKTYLADVLRFVELEWRPEGGHIVLEIDTGTLASLHLGIAVSDIANAVCRDKKLKILPSDVRINGNIITVHISISGASGPPTRPRGERQGRTAESSDMLLKANFLRRKLPSVVISGHPAATRALIESTEDNTYRILVEGQGLRACMTTAGVIGTQVTTNSVIECSEVLGIEAARTTIVKEMDQVMGYMDIDHRHMHLLADAMTYKGEVLGITRYGLSKTRDSVLHPASFEKTADHLFDAVAGMKTDRLDGVSESIILGQTTRIGTGGFKMVRRLGIQSFELCKKPTLFEDSWRAQQKLKKFTTSL